MIRLKSPSNDWQIITPTIFPDKTSQVWKIDMPETKIVIIKWNFESESELIYLAQLVALLGKNNNREIILEIPYLPYARQDKDISNNTTFARDTFLRLLSTMDFIKIITYDIHSDIGFGRPYGRFESKKPIHIHQVIKETKPDIIFYPDEGALNRYSRMFLEEKCDLNMLPKAYGEKIRDQLTGTITGYNIENLHDLKGKNILIIDDICDGGATFIEAAKKLLELGANSIDLCVSHGIFSKGKEHLYKNGIRNIYCTNSLIKNNEGYEV